jgi:glycosyltransferase involved in cell wall biosynthesis
MKSKIAMNTALKYIVITPIRDEEMHIEKTIDSMVSQQILPEEWILVDDGSTDRTGSIIDEYSKIYPWIRVIHIENRGFRKSGGGVVEAFNCGLHSVSVSNWDFLVKLDGDLSFPSDYFNKCIEYFVVEPRLGIGGGDIYHNINGKLILEENPTFHVRGATKIYRKACWDALGGLIAAPGWDTLDEVKANMLGWKTRCFADLKLVHHKYTGSADGTWGGFVKNGRGAYIAGYHPLFMIIKCLLRTFRKPILIGALGLLYGFVSGHLKGIPQVEDRELISYLRSQQMNRILMRESIWM